MNTREWLYIIFIVILLQFIIQVSAWLYGGNTGALGYISFAGTIISIILAVLAIVYSYVQSISQQTSAEKISNQVEKLIGVTGKIELSKEGLFDSINHLNNMAQKLDESIAHQGKISKQVDSIAERFERTMSGELQFKKAASDSGSVSDDEGTVASRVFSYGYAGLITQSIFMYYGAKLGLSVGVVGSELNSKVLKEIVNNADDGFDRYNEGMSVVAWQFFVINDCIVLHDGEEGDSSKLYSLCDEFEKRCALFIDEKKNKIGDTDNSGLDKLYNAIILHCESHLNSQGK